MSENISAFRKAVLVVDDDAGLSDNVLDILREEGYQLYTAASCAEARSVLIQAKPQAALLALKLPDGSGVQLLAELKRMDPDCIFSIMTAYADLDSAVAALGQGAFHYLQKPVRPAELIAHLGRVFENIQLRDGKRQAEKRLQQSEERLRMIFETAQDFIFIKDLRLRYTHVNRSMMELLSLRSTDVLGRTDEEIHGPETGACLQKTDSRVLAGESVEEEQIILSGAVPRTIHVVKAPMRDSSGEINGILGIARDITERRQLESRILQVQKMEAVGTLAGGIAHDFNNLLQAILGCAELVLLGREKGGSGYRELQDIVNAAKRGSELTRQLLTFSRKIESKKEPVNLNEKVENVRRLLTRTIPKMIDIEVTLSDSLRKVFADPVQMEQVLMNLAVNARDAMPAGGRLTIETGEVLCERDIPFKCPDLEPGDYVLLSVSDTGHGMDAQTLEHIFEPFYTTKGIGAGTGLGLASVYGIVKEHDGHISCHSSPGAGTRFEIYIPAMEREDSSSSAQDAEHLAGGSETILLVDDDEFMRSFGETLLSRYGYQVILGEDGEDALDIYRLRMKEIDLVILDLLMPGMGGKRCLEELLLLNPQAKVLIASGYSPEWTADNPQADLAKGFVPKPYEISTMLKTIRNVLDDV